MWELIRANRRRSVVLLLVMLWLLLGLGFAIGGTLVGGMALETGEYAGSFQSGGDLQSIVGALPFSVAGGLMGMGVALVIWLVQAVVAYFQGGRILLAVSGAKKLEKRDHPRLFNVVEEMTIAAQLPKVPDIYLIDDPSMNAFAAGRDPEHSAVAVTSGLLKRLNRDELQGVVAHEISHVIHRDVLYMTMVSVMLGTIVLLSEGFFRMAMHAMRPGRYRARSGKNNGGAGILVILAVALVLYLVTPLLAQLIYFAISRRREYLADAGAAVLTRYPEGLASALEQLGKSDNRLESPQRATAPLFIVNPFRPDALWRLMSTHPPVTERVKVLRGLQGGVSYAGYQQSYNAVHGGGGLVPKSALAEGAMSLRGPSVEEPEDTPRARARATGNALMSLEHYLFLNCTCGVTMKLPPNFPKPDFVCPRCHTRLRVADAVAGPPPQQGNIPTAKPKPAPPGGEVVHIRKGGWESVRCGCGNICNIAPSFTESETACNRCGGKIRLVRE